MAKGKTSRTPLSEKLFMLVGVLIFGLLCAGMIFLTVKHTKEYKASKSWPTTLAMVDGDVTVDTIYTKDDKGNIKSETSYYDYDYFFMVDGKEYTGEVRHLEKYYGDTFDVVYDPEDPSHFLIGDEAKFPLLMWVISALMVVAEGVAVFKLITE